jgi:hypothetical protein
MDEFTKSLKLVCKLQQQVSYQVLYGSPIESVSVSGSIGHRITKAY